MGKKSTEQEEEPLPNHLRCSRTDGRKWRCRRRVMVCLKLCETHYFQGRRRQNKEKVPDSLKLQRKTSTTTNNNQNGVVSENVEIRAKLMKKKKKKRKQNSEDAIGPSRKEKNKNVDIRIELLTMVLEREIQKRDKEKKTKKKNQKEKEEEVDEDELLYSEEELRRELPNGVMEIAPASSMHIVGSHSDVKVSSFDQRSVTLTPRYFRSRNVDRNTNVVSCGRNLKKGKRKRRCHWCQSSDSWNFIKCSNCEKEFFCMDCIKERYSETQDEVKMACPVCQGTCTCKDCFASQRRDNESKEYLDGKSRVDRILHFHYLICMLLPVLKQISEDQQTELETEAKVNGKRISDILIKQVQFGCNEESFCNHCKTTILDLHRSCIRCSYSLCLSCCQEFSQGSTSEEISSSMSKLPDNKNTCIASENHLSDDKASSSSNLSAISILPEWTSCNGTASVSCPPTELGGCGDSRLDLRCIFPLSWIKEMEVKAEEIVCSYDFPETLDKKSSCSLCNDKDHETNGYKQLQEAAQREDSNDNCLFYPTVLDIRHDHFEHFQKHWGKGHPVVVRDVLQSTSKLSWDPLVMFCAYLERSITRYENDKDSLEACLDWCEVEINIKQYFTGSFKYQSQKNTWHEMLKLKGWLSSQLFKEQFPAYFAEVINALPVREYMSPVSCLLNLAANLPKESSKHDTGPYVYISYDCADKEAVSVTKLCYDSYDVVNIMAHATDDPLSAEQLTKIRRLLKKHKALCQRESSKSTTDNAEDAEQKELRNMVRDRKDFFRRVNRTSCISTEVRTAGSQCSNTNISADGECGSNSDTEKVQSSLTLQGTTQHAEMSPDHDPGNPVENSASDKSKMLTENNCAQWDVFRRKDVPKLLEYLKRHHNEFSYIDEYHENMVHPILDQSFFLDDTHKMRLKEEFKIEPWTFEQHIGEAVIVPAGCPYQIRSPKCCVHVVLEFVSPENATECIKLVDEVRLLRKDHKAKVDKLEVNKMALNSMSTDSNKRNT
ncbi:putative chromatin regulator PHD family [Lupinus albus]|uniref:Putative chromatin regulator PHD family n=1 Tax=Lupinus albus TaxID=3870 RepID=A0A6A4P0S3_LUPAL|nr:putative chromatin regulator PHD family [Lupinus albus]